MSSVKGPTKAPPKGADFWRSLEERQDTPAFREMLREKFPHLVAFTNEPRTRRGFFKLMGASLAMAGMVGCRRPEEPIVPHATRPAGREPGVPVQYATAMELGGLAQGLLVTSYDGRPVKVEGNDLHPASLGGSTALAQAAILELYDPERSTSPLRRERGSAMEKDWEAWDGFARAHFDTLKAQGGQGLAVLSEASESPTMARLRAALAGAFPRARWHEYEALSRDAERDGAALAFGEPARTHLHLDQAEVVVCLDADPLFDHPDAVRHSRDFAQRRKGVHGQTSRLYAVEAAYSLTGAMADHRIPLRASGVPAVAAQIARQLADHGLSSEALRQAAAAADSVVDPGFPRMAEMIEDLVHHRARSLVVAGPRQPAAVHALCHAINVGLGAVGHTVTYTADPDPDRASHGVALSDLTAAMAAGEVTTLLIVGGNPVYDAPADVDFTGALGQVSTVTAHLSLYDNETSEACTWHLPRAHFLESWGDARGPDGTVSVIQPLIAPMYGGRTPIELLTQLLGEPHSGMEQVKQTLRGEGDGADSTWRRALQDGVIAGSAWTAVVPDELHVEAIATEAARVARGEAASGFEVIIAADPKLYDGRFANNGWLQELPEALTKVTWDNPVLLAPKDAERLGVATNDRVAIAGGDVRVEATAYVMPGQTPGTLTVTVGSGRTAAGSVGDGVGSDFSSLRTTGSPYLASGAELIRLDAEHDLACTQDHYPMDAIGEAGLERRLDELYRSADLATYEHHPEFAQHVVHHPPLDQQWKPHEYDGHRWAMAIDLSACNGCNACLVACQAENNVPVVGRKQVEAGREMHWLRLDRYFRGDPDEPTVALMPVTCHHCENAPCEQVCPVAATVHDHEGLNVMVYNRCIGTRYCSNNCPYKVRRFNFFKYQDPQTDVEKMRFNPNVTVRSRGVMEKCSFCVQRINRARIQAENEGRELRDGDIVPACAQACPAGAVVFGDLSDPQSRISKLHADPRSYAMLGEMNNRPRLKYMAKLTNPAGAEAHAEPADEEHH